MVILRVRTENEPEKQVEIVTERGVWGSGAYKIYAAKFLNRLSHHKEIPHEPTDKNDPNFLGEISIDKEEEKNRHKTKKDFIIDDLNNSEIKRKNNDFKHKNIENLDGLSKLKKELLFTNNRIINTNSNNITHNHETKSKLY